jgi:pimeloyl-ACP methyl ester carboxylesterase
MHIPFRGETKELNDTVRQSAGGSFVSLPDGITHYEFGGNESGSVVVLVHGFSVPSFIFDPTFDFLVRSGFRVLRYDLFGRGYSDRPDVRYDINLFVRQLASLLDALRLSLPVNLVGLSMGGPITATFLTRHPERVRSLTLIDPAGARAVALPPLIRVLNLPLLAEAIIGLVGGEPFVESNARDFFDPALVEHFKSRYRVQMQYKGFLRAALSTVRSGMLGSFMDVYRQAGRLDVPVALFFGREDKTVPFEHSNELRAVMPNLQFHVIEKCGHIPHYEKPDEFNPILFNFLKS